ncbi:amino acid ABC transporter permease [Pelagicoccus sp. SDUM812002]|uniref:amino acid ABC transporter permease n=1 Tax=Pelagicoccus sp. SDUM812002 TaxID=3041266 RepID=UPI00280F9030|nr:amino acid ABC transporter permease [Pelagicoccus sp. SDUM812002]MDQ8186485.1 amino acid ABC transporter permease [Pelagicoccus sp. SDUM812002]
MLTDFFQHLVGSFPALLKGAGYTVLVALLSMGLGLLLGLFVCLGKISKERFLRVLCSGYIDVFRGTPLLVQILFIYFGFPSLLQQLFGQPFPFDPLVAGTVAFTLNAAAYIAEILRAGISSLGKGQLEAAESLGLSYIQAMRFVILPQALRRMIPALGNEFVTLLKDTSLLSAIAVTEIVKEGRLYISRTYAAFPTYFAIALLYFVLTFIATRIFNRLEERFKIHD